MLVMLGKAVNMHLPVCIALQFACMQNCKCPLQGDADEVVPFAHGKALHAAAKNPYPPLWACGYGHQNLEFCKQYLPALHDYLRSLFGKDYGKL